MRLLAEPVPEQGRHDDAGSLPGPRLGEDYGMVFGLAADRAAVGLHSQATADFPKNTPFVASCSSPRHAAARAHEAGGAEVAGERFFVWRFGRFWGGIIAKDRPQNDEDGDGGYQNSADRMVLETGRR